MRKFFKEPLLHFLVAGAALFFLNHYLGGQDSSDTQLIIVDRSVLEKYLQYQAKTFDELRTSELLNAMGDDEREQLINDYVREESLYREALSLKLNRNDTVIKNRLIQKMKFIVDGVAPNFSSISDQELENFFDHHKSRYYISPSITFTHVFFDGRARDDKTALSMAQAELTFLDHHKVPFSDALRYGDRFLYHANYVGKTPDFLVGHFGSEIVSALFDNSIHIGRWLGPFKSDYGYHLVLVAKKLPGRNPDLSEIRERVYQEAVKERAQKASEETIQEILKTYQIEIEV